MELVRNKASQTHFGFTQIGLEMRTFRVTAILITYLTLQRLLINKVDPKRTIPTIL